MGNCGSDSGGGKKARPAATPHPQAFRQQQQLKPAAKRYEPARYSPPPTPPQDPTPPPRRHDRHHDHGRRTPQAIPPHMRRPRTPPLAPQGTPPHTPPPQRAAGYPLGARVDGYWENAWYPAVVKALGADGRYDLHWDDGTLSFGVPAEFIRPQGGGGATPPRGGGQPPRAANVTPGVRLADTIVGGINEADEVGIELFRRIGGTPGVLLPGDIAAQRLASPATLRLFGWPAGRHRELLDLLMQIDEHGNTVLSHECCQHYARVVYLFALTDISRDGYITSWALQRTLLDRRGVGVVVRKQLGIQPHLAAALFRQMDRDGNGRITLVEFFRHYVMNPLENRYDGMEGLNARQLFRRLSAGNRPQLRLEDLERAMEAQEVQLELGWPQHKARELFEFLDHDRSGTVSLEEMQKFLTVQQVFNRIDEDRTGFIDPFEFGECLADTNIAAVLGVRLEDAQKVFRDIDRDRSGAITFGEFFAYFANRIRSRDPTLIPIKPASPNKLTGGQQYTTHKKLGEGTFGRVFLITRKTDGLKLILKEPKVENLGSMDEVQAEADMLAKVKHPHIVRFIECYWEQGALIIITEFAEGGDLRAKVGLNNDPKTVMRWFTESCDAINYLHERFIIHRDLKPDNIFLTAGGYVKIGDLGLATQMRGGNDIAFSQCGTEIYMPPELLKGEGYTVQNDVWAMGCILYELATGRFAFRNVGDIVYCRAPTDAPAYCRNIVNRILVADPNRRPRIRQVLEMLNVLPGHGMDFSLSDRYGLSPRKA